MVVAERSVFTLPKAHLHAHLIPSARPETTRELAERYGIDLTDAWTFSNPARVYRAGRALVPGDPHARRSGPGLPRVRRGRGGPGRGVHRADDRDGLLLAAVRAEPGRGVRDPRRGVPGRPRRRPASRSAICSGFCATSRRRMPRRSLGSPPSTSGAGRWRWGWPATRPSAACRRSARAFEIAREAGLLVVPHAGESVGPASVRDGTGRAPARSDRAWGPVR